jgi:hypothetical protein
MMNAGHKPSSSLRFPSMLWLLLFLPSFFSMSAWGQLAKTEHQHSPVFQARQILLRPMTVELLMEMTELRISEGQKAALRSILPLPLALTNHSNRAILQITVRYKSSLLKNPGTSGYFTMQLNSLHYNSRGAWIGSGQTVFLCPSSALSSQVSGNRGTPNEWSGSAAAVARRFTREWAVSISLDSVVFEDGEVIGPDEFHVIEQQTESARGRADLLAQVREQFLAGDAKLAGLTEWLRRTEAADVGMNLVTGRPDYYQSAQLGTATTLIGLRSGVADDRFADLLESMIRGPSGSSQPEIQLRKATQE